MSNPSVAMVMRYTIAMDRGSQDSSLGRMPIDGFYASNITNTDKYARKFRSWKPFEDAVC